MAISNESAASLLKLIKKQRSPLECPSELKDFQVYLEHFICFDRLDSKLCQLGEELGIKLTYWKDIMVSPESANW